MRLSLAVFGFAAMMGPAFAVEEPPFTLVAKWADCELRAYPALTVAETTLAGERGAAEWSGFSTLAGYIFGGNAGNAKIEMVAPVMTTRTGEGWTIRFTMPAGSTLAKLPKPSDANVHLRAAPAVKLAVIEFPGVVGDADMEAKIEELRACMRAHGLAAAGTPALAQYNGPWTMGPWRRNEVMAPAR